MVMFALVGPRVSARLHATGLDARLAAGEYPFASPGLAVRAAQLVSRHSRGVLATGLRHALTRDRSDGALSSSVAVDRQAVTLARPALAQLAEALGQRERPGVRGVAMTRVLLTAPDSPLYAARYPEELYEWAREALLAL
jgi:hypothetical protein